MYMDVDCQLNNSFTKPGGWLWFSTVGFRRSDQRRTYTCVRLWSGILLGVYIVLYYDLMHGYRTHNSNKKKIQNDWLSFNVFMQGSSSISPQAIVNVVLSRMSKLFYGFQQKNRESSRRADTTSSIDFEEEWMFSALMWVGQGESVPHFGESAATANWTTIW